MKALLAPQLESLYCSLVFGWRFAIGLGFVIVVSSVLLFHEPLVPTVVKIGITAVSELLFWAGGEYFMRKEFLSLSAKLRHRSRT